MRKRGIPERKRNFWGHGIVSEDTERWARQNREKGCCGKGHRNLRERYRIVRTENYSDQKVCMKGSGCSPLKSQ